MKLFKKLKRLFNNSEKDITVSNAETFATFNQKVFNIINIKEWYLLDYNISLHVDELEECTTFDQLFNRATQIIIGIGKLTGIQNQAVDKQFEYYRILRKYSMIEAPSLETFKQYHVEFLPGFVYNTSNMSFNEYLHVDILINEYCKTYAAIINKYNDI